MKTFILLAKEEWLKKHYLSLSLCLYITLSLQTYHWSDCVSERHFNWHVESIMYSRWHHTFNTHSSPCFDISLWALPKGFPRKPASHEIFSSPSAGRGVLNTSLLYVPLKCSWGTHTGLFNPDSCCPSTTCLVQVGLQSTRMYELDFAFRLEGTHGRKLWPRNSLCWTNSTLLGLCSHFGPCNSHFTSCFSTKLTPEVSTFQEGT